MTTLAARLAQPDMAGLTDAQASAVLTAPDAALATRRVDVATGDAREVLLSTGEWVAVVLTADNVEAPAQVRGACIVLRDTITETGTIRSSVPAIYGATAALLGALVAAGVLTAGTRDALLALADRPQSWAEANGVSVDARAVGLARGSV